MAETQVVLGTLPGVSFCGYILQVSNSGQNEGKDVT